VSVSQAAFSLAIMSASDGAADFVVVVFVFDVVLVLVVSVVVQAAAKTRKETSARIFFMNEDSFKSEFNKTCDVLL
jgi:hypothetical protein